MDHLSKFHLNWTVKEPGNAVLWKLHKPEKWWRLVPRNQETWRLAIQNQHQAFPVLWKYEKQHFSWIRTPRISGMAPSGKLGAARRFLLFQKPNTSPCTCKPYQLQLFWFFLINSQSNQFHSHVQVHGLFLNCPLHEIFITFTTELGVIFYNPKSSSLTSCS